VWRNVPKVYKAMLRKGKLHLALAIEKSSEAISIIAGKIVKNDLSQPGEPRFYHISRDKKLFF
jgi:hypothetical protein